jgi:tetratricopeptide (TPR) repeat protein
MSSNQKRFEEAIPLFEEAGKIQEKAGNNRGAGHTHNNLIACFNETGDFERAITEADRALELYDDPQLDHSFTARYRKSQTYIKLGRLDDALKIYDLNIKLIEENDKLSPEEKEKRIKQHNANIEKTNKLKEPK